MVSQTGYVDGYVKTGVMIRQGSTDPQAPYFGVFATPSNGVIVQWRPSEGAQTNQLLANPAGGNSTLPAVTPVYVLAERYTNTTTGVVYYSGFTSSDGVHWTWIPGSTVAMTLTGPLTSGIATDSHNDAAYTVATVDSLAQFGGASTPPGVCPTGWSCTDVGGALPPGQDSLANGTWSEVGGGGDIWTNADAFHLVNQTLAGDGSVTAHVTAQQNTSAFAKAGPMLRATTDPGSPYYAAFITPGQGIAVQWRPAQGAQTNQLLVPGTAPVYLKVTRYTSGAIIYYSAYSSPDGTTWTLIPGSTQVLAMSGTLLAGFGITSHAQGTGSAVTLDTVAITPGETPPPGTCPTGWSCSDIGGALPAGSDTLANTTWTESGGGGDIWGTADAFHFASQPVTGDAAVTAHVTAQQNTSSWAKAGVMLRATTDPGSPYYAAFVTPGQGLAVQWRSAQAGTSNQVSVAGTVPVYLRVSRYTTTGTNPQTYFNAFTSSDGVTWTLVPGSTVALALGQPLLGGLAITSHNQGAASVVTLDTVSVTAGEYPGPRTGLPARLQLFRHRGGHPGREPDRVGYRLDRSGRRPRHLGHGRRLPFPLGTARRQRLGDGPGVIGHGHRPVGQGRGHGPGHHRPGLAFLRRRTSPKATGWWSRSGRPKGAPPSRWPRPPGWRPSTWRSPARARSTPPPLPPTASPGRRCPVRWPPWPT